MLNPNCSTIVCKLPSTSNYKTAEALALKIDASNLDNKIKEKTKGILIEWSYDCQGEVDTASYPNYGIDWFLERADALKKIFKKWKEFPEILCVDNCGGGGNWDYIESSWRIAKLYAVGKFTKDEAMKFDKKLWEFGQDPVLTNECEKCLEENQIKKDCKEYVKRVVGECEGEHLETPNEILTRMEGDVDNDTKPKL